MFGEYINKFYCFINIFILIYVTGFSVHGKELPFPRYYHALHRLPDSTSRDLASTEFSLRRQGNGRTLKYHSNSSLAANRYRRLRERPSSEITAIYAGYGTHFTYVYVGTPAQRQSLIIHTASKYTTFPCTGCKDCGEHTDPYFDLSTSRTAKVAVCNHDVCLTNQTYSEGSSWRGFRVKDTFYVGDELASTSSIAAQFAVNLTFSCQSSLHGIFWAQKENGILGMNGDEDAVPWQLLSQKAINHKLFALCFHRNGGIMTIGGVNPSIHDHRTILYAKMEERIGGLYGLLLYKVKLVSPASTIFELSDLESYYATTLMNPKGVYLDSATTDTYLPTYLRENFQTVFQQITKKRVSYDTKKNIHISSEDYANLPDIVFDFYGVLSDTTTANSNNKNNPENKYVSIHMTPAQYLLPIPGETDSYVFRIFFTQKSGAILGSNFFLNHNVIIDIENQRIGFVPANCDYDTLITSPTMLPTAAPTSASSNEHEPAEDKDKTHNGDQQPWCPVVTETNADFVADSDLLQYYLPTSACSATCIDATSPTYQTYIATGEQVFQRNCRLPSSATTATSEASTSASSSPLNSFIPEQVRRTCRDNCTDGQIVRGDPRCPDTPWSRCSSQCIRTRQLVLTTAPLYTRTGQCNLVEQNAPCFMQDCPLFSSNLVRPPPYSPKEPVQPPPVLEKEDIAVLTMVWQIRSASVPQQVNWTYVHIESMSVALTKLLPAKFHNIDMTVNNNNDQLSKYVTIVIRLRASDFNNNIDGNQVRVLASSSATLPSILQEIRNSLQYPAKFFALFVSTLDSVAYTMDNGQLHRFAGYSPSDFMLQSYNIQEYQAYPSLFRRIMSLSILDVVLIVIVIITIVALLIVWRLHSQLRSEYILMVQKQDSGNNANSVSQRFRRWATKLTFRPAMVSSFEKLQKSLSTLGLMKPPTPQATSKRRRKQRQSHQQHANGEADSDIGEKEDDSHYTFPSSATASHQKPALVDESDTESSDIEAINEFYRQSLPSAATGAQQQDKRWSGEPGVELMNRY